MTALPPPSPSPRLARWLPALGWLRSYDSGWLRPDLIAGITLAAYLMPAAIGDASLANLPPEAGLYACLLSGLIFWLFCSSRHTAITVTSAISLLIGASLGGLAGGDPTRFGALAACTALLVAALALLAWFFKAGSLVNFVSETVLVGFKAGVACYLTSTQLPKLFGIKGISGDFWERMGDFFRHLDETNSAALAVGLGALAVLVLGKVLLDPQQLLEAPRPDRQLLRSCRRNLWKPPFEDCLAAQRPPSSQSTQSTGWVTR
jgi:MFS superfamily sulfate permease-like transporter